MLELVKVGYFPTRKKIPFGIFFSTDVQYKTICLPQSSLNTHTEVCCAVRNPREYWKLDRSTLKYFYFTTQIQMYGWKHG